MPRPDPDPPPWTSVLPPLGGLLRLAPRFIHLDAPFVGAVQATPIRDERVRLYWDKILIATLIPSNYD